MRTALAPVLVAAVVAVLVLMVPDAYVVAYGAMLIALVVSPIAGVIANYVIWRVYRADTRKPPSWVFRTLVISGTIVNVAGLYIAVVAIAALVSDDALPDLAVLGLGLALLALESVPILMAWEITRRRRREGRPPPFSPAD